MNILAIDTSGGVAGAAVWAGGLLSEIYLHRQNKHSETAMDAVDTALRIADMAIRDVGLVAVSNGPGSFTGLRIGVSIAKGLAQAQDIPCAAINTLDALMQNIFSFNGIICPVMDARRGEVYTAAKDGQNLLVEYGAYPMAELLDRLDKGRPVCFVGDGVAVHRETIKSRLHDKAAFAPQQLMLQRAGAVAQVAAAMDESQYCNAFALEPNYFRMSQAERLRLGK